MVNSTDEKISTLIQKLGDLKKAKNEYHENTIGGLSFVEIDRLENNLWPRDVQPIIGKIEIDLVELWDCIIENWSGRWTKEGIENAIRSRKPDRMNALIQEFKTIRQRLKIKSQRQPPKEPAETGQKEIVEVKPGAFGITVNIKEIAKRIWKCVCSRSKN